MSEFEHQRHKPPSSLDRDRELIVVCAPMRSNINLSRIARTASCAGVRRMICCGTAKLSAKIARDAAQHLEMEVHRSLVPVLRELKRQGRPLIGLEQATDSQSLYTFEFPRNAALVIGNERTGLTAPELQQLDAVVEIPVYGMPFSYNVATATCMAIYEYCRQYPTG